MGWNRLASASHHLVVTLNVNKTPGLPVYNALGGPFLISENKNCPHYFLFSLYNIYGGFYIWLLDELS